MTPLLKEGDEVPFWGTVISTYTRADALRDGVLVELDQKIVSEAGFRVPIAVTSTVWALLNKIPEGQDLTGRIWDLLFMLKMKISRNPNPGPELRYTVILGPRNKIVELKCCSGPGDEGEHVMTIMFPEED